MSCGSRFAIYCVVLLNFFVAGPPHAVAEPEALAAPVPIATPMAIAPPSVTVRWTGVTGLVVSDGEATLLFDPVFTKPSLANWFFGTQLVSDADRVRRGLDAAKVTHADAVFVSHTHFDHAVDAAAVAQLTGAVVHGGISLQRVVKRYELPVRFEMAEDHRVVQVGKFKVTMIRREHAAILRNIDWKFLHGEVPENFDFNFYQYYEGEPWCYYLEHPAGNILIDQGSEFFEPNSIYKGKVHTYFMGVANRRSIEDLIYGNMLRIQPRRVVPIHFDAFFLQADWLERLRYLGGTLDTIKARLELEKQPHPEFLIPTLNQSITIP